MKRAFDNISLVQIHGESEIESCINDCIFTKQILKKHRKNLTQNSSLDSLNRLEILLKEIFKLNIEFKHIINTIEFEILLNNLTIEDSTEKVQDWLNKSFETIKEKEIE